MRRQWQTGTQQMVTALCRRQLLRMAKVLGKVSRTARPRRMGMAQWQRQRKGKALAAWSWKGKGAVRQLFWSTASQHQSESHPRQPKTVTVGRLVQTAIDPLDPLVRMVT